MAKKNTDLSLLNQTNGRWKVISHSDDGLNHSGRIVFVKNIPESERNLKRNLAIGASTTLLLIALILILPLEKVFFLESIPLFFLVIAAYLMCFTIPKSSQTTKNLYSIDVFSPNDLESITYSLKLTDVLNYLMRNNTNECYKLLSILNSHQYSESELKLFLDNIGDDTTWDYRLGQGKTLDLSRVSTKTIIPLEVLPQKIYQTIVEIEPSLSIIRTFEKKKSFMTDNQIFDYNVILQEIPKVYDIYLRSGYEMKEQFHNHLKKSSELLNTLNNELLEQGNSEMRISENYLDQHFPYNA